MCGIAGVFCKGDARLTVPEVQRLLKENQYRGRDATGVAWRRKDRVVYSKLPEKAEDFFSTLSDDVWAEIAASPIILLHTRMKTKGDAKKNENNHPVVGYGWAVVHNGMVSNDDLLWEHFDNKNRFAEVDTSAIPLVLSRGTSFYDSLSWLSVLEGSAAIAAWSEKDIDTVTLARVNGNVVHLGLDPDRDLLMWSSDVDGFGKDVFHTKIFGNLTFEHPQRNILRATLPDNHALVLGPGKEELYHIERSPFFRPKSTITTPVSTVRSIAVSTNTGRPSVSYRHIPGNHKEFVDKPIPVFNQKTLEWDYCDLRRLLDKFADPSVKDTGLQTPYGNWHFWRNDDGKIYKLFDPNKKPRKFFEHKFGEGWLLPPLGVNKNELDDKMTLERLEIKHMSGPSSSVETFGFACPWCMVWHTASEWRHNGFRCNFCSVRSKTPEGYNL